MEQTARVEIISRRVEQSNANPARIQTANRISRAACAIRQSMSAPNACNLPALLMKLMTTKESVLIPTTLMGGTLPVLTRAFMGEDRARLRPSLGRLYGLNTLGAVAGTALAGFLLIEFVGVRASLWLTAAINLAIGATALWLGRDQPSATAPTSPWSSSRSGSSIG